MWACRLGLLLLSYWLLLPAGHGQSWRRGVANRQLQRFTQNEPTWLVPGLSLGAGGAQHVVGLTADLHYGPLTLRLHPGLWHYGAALQYYFDFDASIVNPRQRPIYLELTYLNAWALGLPDHLERRRRMHLLIGKRLALSRPGDVYLEAGVGMQVRWDTPKPEFEPDLAPLVNYRPFAEVRLGVAFLGKRLLPRDGRPLFGKKTRGGEAKPKGRKRKRRR